jgi:hypothetical protein
MEMVETPSVSILIQTPIGRSMVEMESGKVTTSSRQIPESNPSIRNPDPQEPGARISTHTKKITLRHYHIYG